MGVDQAVLPVAQVVLEGLGEGLYPGLGDIVGGVAGRRRDALLGSGVDDQAGAAALDHLGREDLAAVDDAPQVHLKDAFPVLPRPEYVAAGLDAGIVHQHVGAAEPLADGGLQRAEILQAADVALPRHDFTRAAGVLGGDRFGGRLQAVRAEIGNACVKAERPEALRCGQSDAGGAAGDDGDGTRSQDRVSHLCLLVESASSRQPGIVSVLLPIVAVDGAFQGVPG